MKGTSAVLVIGVGRRGVGRDNSTRWCLLCACEKVRFSDGGYLVSMPRAQGG
jgi:hypothetical protein